MKYIFVFVFALSQIALFAQLQSSINQELAINCDKLTPSEEIILSDYSWLMNTSNSHACNTADKKLKEPSKEALTEPDSGTENLKVYPNPSGICRFNLELDVVSGPTKILLSNLNGRQLYSEDLGSFIGHYSKQIDLSVIKSSMVVLSIIQKEGTITRKIVVE